MNAKRSAPQLGCSNHHLSLQLVLMRDNRPFGSEVRIHIDDTAPPSSAHAKHKKSSLYSAATTQPSKVLRDHGRTLANSTTKLCAPVIRRFYKDAAFQNAYLLKVKNIETDFGENQFHEKIAVFLTTLKPFSYTKSPISNGGFSFRLTAKPKHFNQSHNHMNMLTHNAKATIISHRVEHAASRILARALAFDYFQGSHYSPADNI